MGRPPCCDEIGVKKGPWTKEEDDALIEYIKKHGDGNWRHLPKLAGLNRCGKSCRLRWANYLRPDIKRGKFSDEEERLIIRLHSELGNKWSAIAARLERRTDNEIKNYWNTHLRKKLLRMGIDPVTHLPRTDLDLLSSFPDLVVDQFNPMSYWDQTIRLQAHAANLAKLQIFQRLIQTMTNRSVPNLDATGLLGSNYQLYDPQELQRQFGGLFNGSLGLPNPILMSPNFSNFGYSDYQGHGESSLSLGVESNCAASASDIVNQIADSTTSSENLTINQTQYLISPSLSPVKSPEALNIGNLEDDFSWEDILNQISWSDNAV